MAHVFFNSYARLDNTKYTKLGDVIEELGERVRAALGAKEAKDVAFFDKRDINTGAEWENFLGEAIRHARVLVCFCSNTYFNSEYCAKEFDVFRRRLEAANGKHTGVVIPVIWERCDLPKALSKYQFEDKRFPQEYASTGLCSLRRVKGQRTKYNSCIETLKDIIVKAAKAKALPSFPTAVAFDTLPSAFDNPGRYNVRVMVLHDRGLLWELEPGNTLRRMVEAVAAALNVPWQEAKADDQIAARLHEASKAREAVVLVSAESALAKAPWTQRWQAADQAALQNCAALVGFDNSKFADTNAIDARLRQLLPQSWNRHHCHAAFSLHDTAAFEQHLTRAITKLRLDLIQADPGERVKDQGLENAAHVDGNSTKLAVINGPGGGAV